MAEARLITLDPGHFHAALVQKEMYPGVAKQAQVYAPLGPDLIAHLQRIAGFNARRDNPTRWELEIHTGPDALQRMLLERLGNVVVLSGRNREKIDRILAAVEAGLNVLADKPWIISSEDLPKLQAALDTADANRVIAYDIMTERHEVTTIIQRELVNDPDIFGDICVGGADEPGVFMERPLPACPCGGQHGFLTSRSKAKDLPTWARTWLIWCFLSCSPTSPSSSNRRSRFCLPSAGPLT
jgi:hypothetical protein